MSYARMQLRLIFLFDHCVHEASAHEKMQLRNSWCVVQGAATNLFVDCNVHALLTNYHG